jgi:hypothetical protein
MAVTGRARAMELIAYMRDQDAPTLLGHVVDAIMRAGTYGAAEIGFFQVIGEHLIY